MINGLIEVIVYVQDMDAQVKFYRDTMELKVQYPQGLEDYSQEMWVTLDTGACTLALHGGSQGRLGKDTPKFVFGVDDIYNVRTQLIGKSVKLGEVRTAAPGVLVCDGYDPEGNPFSIESHEGMDR